jgi:hypothetical protein
MSVSAEIFVFKNIDDVFFIFILAYITGNIASSFTMIDE